MNTSQVTAFSLSRESQLRSEALADSIKFVGRGANRTVLVIAGENGNWEAGRIVELFQIITTGNYRRDHIDELNALVADWQASHA